MPEIVNSAPQNLAKPYVNHHHSHFPIEYNHFDTHAFGYIKPHFCIKGISSDSHSHRPVVKTTSYTLKAPLLQDVFRKLSYFKVNLHAILPINADKVITNPTIGDDVTTFVNCAFPETGAFSFFRLIADSFESAISASLTTFAGTPNGVNLKSVLKSLVFGELFYSRGSLLSSLGASIYNQFSVGISGSSKLYDFDDYFDLCIQSILTGLGSNSFYVQIDGTNFTVNPSFDYSDSIIGTNEISFRDFLTFIRETSNWSISSSSDSVVSTIVFPTVTRGYTYANTCPFNFSRVFAYQLACSEFFTNDSVDYIYSAELFRQHISDLLTTIAANSTVSYPTTFSYNGVATFYDILSGRYLYDVFNYVKSSSSLYSNSVGAFAFQQYFLSLFGLKRSLRFKDYFAGARTNPLAVGDVNVAVNSNNEVSVVDVSRHIQIQRFLNVVNHAGRILSNYVKTLYGVEVGPDRHVPQFIAELTEKVYTAEVENTGVAQLSSPQSITAVFSGNSSNKEIHFGVDLESVIIGVTTYDIERAYINSIDRDFFIKDRYDMFLPQLQFVGDQPIYRQEISARDTSVFGQAFGYQYRDMQWKQIFSRATGGFAGKLPGYAFLSRNHWFALELNPEFIRCFPTEFDNFYVSLAGWSLGNYYHFIVHTHNILDADRPMIANPTILE